MMKCLLGVVLILVIVSSTRAGNLSLSGSNLTWDPLSSPSPEFVVGVENPTNLTDPLFAWSLGLEILPGAGAVGNVKFASAILPANYLLAGRSEGLTPAFSGPSTQVLPIADSDSLFTGIVVPAAGKNLLATLFVATPGAHGDFLIAVVPDPFTGANWFSSDFQNTREFGNVPFSSGSVVIGKLTIVPEPQTAILMLCGLALLVLHYSRVTSRHRFI